MFSGGFWIGKYREEGSHFSPSGRSNPPSQKPIYTPRIPNPQQQLPESRRFGILENPEEIRIPFEEKISESNICLRVGVRGDSSLFDAEVVCDPLHFSSNYRGNGRIL